MNGMEVADRRAQELELVLEQVLGACGPGLHEKTRSVQSKLPAHVVRRLRWVASARRRLAMEGASAEDESELQTAINELLSYLGTLTFQPSLQAEPAGARVQRRRDSSKWSALLVGAAAIAMLVMAFDNLRAAFSAEPAKPGTPEVVTAQPPPPPQPRPADAVTPQPEAAAGLVESTPVSSSVVAAPPPSPVASLAPQPAAATDVTQDLERARADVASRIWDYLRAHTQVSLDAPRLQHVGGGVHEVLVQVHWSIEPEPLLQALNTYFWQPDLRPYVADWLDFDGQKDARHFGVIVRRAENSGAQQKLPFSSELLDELLSSQVLIVVRGAGHSGALRIVGGRGCASCEDTGEPALRFHLTDKNKPGALLFRPVEGEQNPLSLGRFTPAELASLGRLTAEVEITTN